MKSNGRKLYFILLNSIQGDGRLFYHKYIIVLNNYKNDLKIKYHKLYLIK